ncbi:hypothetical protein EGI22_14950 [Lacihabitans sp. LS3-19]|uniref:tetratricopeptide repeat-containing sensor histidine kinase n=1 Tax=Lacihabitans sp. LS3-19 TaxID=2487335 RepID=UPI0020CCE551|nr:histidine kinase [Lacihabitans sp. LS3-19]MCP9769214.1 hypothetical protein [Lacihabitans sp. LS3-19]
MYNKIILSGITILMALIKLSAQTAEIKKYNLYKNKYDSLVKLPSSFHRDTLKLMCLDSIIETPPMVNKGKLYYDEYKEIAYRINWKKGIARYKMYYGNSSIFDKKPVESVKVLLEAERELEKLRDYPSQIYTLMRLSMALTHKTDSLSALSYIDKAILVAKKIKSKKWILYTLNYKGNTLIFRERLDLAIPIFEEIDKFKDIDNRTKIFNDLNLGMCYLNSNKEEEGMEFINRTLSEMPKDISDYISLHKQVRYDLIKYFIEKKGNYEKAKRYFEELKSYQFSNTGNSMAEIYGYNQNGYKIYKGLKNHKRALYFMEQSSIYKDSLNAESIKNGQEGIKAQLALQYQTEKLQKTELEKLKTESKNQNQLWWFFFLMSTVGLIITIYVIRTNKKLKKRNEELLGKNAEISQALLKGQTIERQRVALDLHDNLGSTLSALWLSIDTIDKSKMNTEEKAIHQNLRENLEKAYNDVRLLSHNLLPEEFEKLGLLPTLQGFFRKMNKNSAIKFDLKIDEDFGRIENKIEFELYSICLELVNNIVKHSKASEAKITLSRTEKEIYLIISDNGIGTFKNDSDGKGMKNVKARVESLNGVWEVKRNENMGVVNEIFISF